MPETSRDPLHGRIVNTSNQGVSGAQVYSSNSSDVRYSQDSASTDDGGYYLLNKGFPYNRERSLRCGSTPSEWTMAGFIIYVIHPQYETLRVGFFPGRHY